jgi:hypothetical protein
MKTFKILICVLAIVATLSSCTEEPVLPAGGNVQTESNVNRF